jgi:amino acid adenylation domain-containing protein/non-ribosomal peptide synthase protein (TIGR01720 family)
MTKNASRIAIVGRALRVPGAATPQQFWDNIANGVGSCLAIDEAKLRAAGVSAEELRDPKYVRVSASFGDESLFDADLFGITPSEAALIDPQQRLLLECARAALEDGGYVPERTQACFGVFAGVGPAGYLVRNIGLRRDIVERMGTQAVLFANDKSYAATRIAFKLNMQGPAVAVDTACSTGLVAVHLAARSLLDFECDFALAGAASIMLRFNHGYRFEPGGILAPDGQCRFLDANARGTLFGSGAAVVVLRRYEEAVAAGDQIHGVILGSAINNDGRRKAGFATPSTDGQAAVVAFAQEVAGVAPDAFGYIECHGTGTGLGDPIELSALSDAFGSNPGAATCALGSVKPNIGHLDVAAGLVGMIKAIEVVRRGVIPPLLNFEKLNPSIDLSATPFFVPKTRTAWRHTAVPRRAGVSAFGIGGTNAHLVLEEPAVPAARPQRAAPEVLLFSANTLTSLDASLRAFSEYFASSDAATLSDAAFTLQVGRWEFAERAAVVATTGEQAARALRGDGAIVRGRAARSSLPLAFMFPGQGVQYPKMAYGLYSERAPFRTAFDACAKLVQQLSGIDLVERVFGGGDERALQETAITQPLLFAIEYAYAKLAESVGITPSALIGHSVGEYVAAHLAGVFSLEDVLAIVVLRGQLMQSLPRGAMLALALPEAEALAWTNADVSLAAVNGPNRSVLSGAPHAIEDVRDRLLANNLESTVLRTSHAFHSSMVDPILEAFRAGVTERKKSAPRIPFVSNLTGTWITSEQATSAEYWVGHLRNTVRFADGIQTLLAADPAPLFLEVGPGTTLTRFVAPLARGRGVSLGRPATNDASDEAAFLTGVAGLWAHGMQIEWERIREKPGRRVSLPTYTYDRKRYWIDPPATVAADPPSPPAISETFAVLEWAAASLPTKRSVTTGVWLMFDDERALGASVCAGIAGEGHDCVRVVVGNGFARVAANTYSVRPGFIEDYDALKSTVEAGGDRVSAVISLWPSHAILDGLAHTDKGLWLAREVATIGAVMLKGEPGRLFAMVTRGAHAHSDAARPDPGMASVFGAMRALGLGQSGLRCAAIDIAPDVEASAIPALGAAVLAELSAKLPEWTVVLRGGSRLVGRPRAAAIAADATPLLRRGGVYLMTGGFGELGSLIARSLAARYAARLILLGRSPVPSQERWNSLASASDDSALARMARVCVELKNSGGEVLALQADVSRIEDLARAIETGEATFGPIQGVIHAAGALRATAFDARAGRGARAFADDVFAAKARGAENLAQLLASRKLDFFAFMSSTTAVLGAYQELEYCAANAFLDALAQSLRSADVPALSIGWDTWKSAGMSQRMMVPAGLEALKTKMLAAGFENEEGVDALHALLVSRVPAYVIASKLPFSELFARAKQLSELVARDAAAPAAVRHTPRGADLESAIIDAVRSVLGLSDVSPTDGWFELGADSLLVAAIYRQLLPIAPELQLMDLFANASPRSLSRFLQRDETHAPVAAAAAPASSEADIAIIAMAGRFPGADSVEELWDRAARGESGFRTLSARELIANGLSEAEANDPLRVPVVGMLSNHQAFDAERFGFTPREAQLTDPQQRVFLECAHEALERAGYVQARTDARISLYAGAGASTYMLANVLPKLHSGGRRPLSAQSLSALEVGVGNDASFFATRVAYKLGLRGAAVTLNTACSTSLVAVHHACRALIAGDCELALAGGANVDVFAEDGYVFEDGGLQSPNGLCKTFDAGASGTVFGSGVGVVLLKRLDHALADADTIHAVIKATAVNNDGPERVGFSAPSAEGQQAVIEAALSRARISARDVCYVEAHGTGTALGDPIEVRALTAAFRRTTGDRQYCALGSIKPNIGHLDAASGVAGLLNAVGVLKRRRIPGVVHFQAPNPLLSLEQTPFFVARESQPLSAGGQCFAAVSSFGIGGTNAHVILQEAPGATAARAVAQGPQALLFSAPSSNGLEALRHAFAKFFANGSQPALSEVAYTLQIGREHLSRRMACVCSAPDEASRRLASSDADGIIVGTASSTPPNIIFMFPGQGAQYVGMAAELHAAEPVYRQAFEACFEAWSPRDPELARSLLLGERGVSDQRMLATSFAQPALFCVEYSVAKLLESVGVTPSAMIGHSLGEYVAAHLAGVLTLEDAVQLVVARGELMETAPRGVMLSLPLPAEEVRSLCDLDVAAINGPKLTVASGSVDEIEQLESSMAARGVETRRLHTSHGFHSKAMDAVLDRFEARVAQVRLSSLRARVLSNVTGTWLTAEQAQDPKYWRQQLRQPVLFWEGLKAAASLKHAVFLEVGPGAALTALAKQGELRGVPSVMSGCRPTEATSGVGRYKEALARLWTLGVEVDWETTHRVRPARVQLPTYPFQRRRFWLERARSEVTSEAGVPNELAHSSDADSGAPLIAPQPAAGDQIGALTSTERAVQELWCEAFGVERVGVHDNFFELGGQSLLAARLVGQIRRRFAVELPLRSFFERPTVAAIAGQIDEAIANAGAQPASALTRLSPLEQRPLSYAQERMWFMQSAAPESTAYNIVAGFSMRGALDIARLEASFRAVMRRHEALRSSFPDVDGAVRVALRAEADAVELEVCSLPVHSGSREDALRALFVEKAGRPFRLATDLLVRVSIVELGADEHALLFVVHHIVADAWSLRVIARDTIAFYRAAVENLEANLSSLGVGFYDHASWQRRRVTAGELEKERAYWKDQLTPLPPPLDLPTSGTRPPRPTYRGARHVVDLPQAVAGRLRQIAGARDASLFIGMLAGFQILLSRYANQEDIALGMPVANRGPVETHDLVGLFVNTLVLRGRVFAQSSYEDVLREARANVLGALAHQELPFEQLVSELKPPRDFGRNPFFDVLFSYVEAPLTASSVGGLEFAPIAVDSKAARLDLTVEVTEAADTVRVDFEYATDLFSAAFIEQLAAHYLALLDCVSSNPAVRASEVSLLSSAARHRILVELNDTERLRATRYLPELLDEQARETPDAPAVTFGDVTLSYAELNKRTSLLACRLRELGVGYDDVVSVCAERSIEMVVALLGVVKAGAAFLPIEPSYPKARIAYMLEDSAARLVLSQQHLSAVLPVAARCLMLDADIDWTAPIAAFETPALFGQSLAYVIYTSGSTGQPKAAMNTHDALANRVAWMQEAYQLDASDVVLQKTPFTFDVSVWEFFWPLTSGAQLVVGQPGEHQDSAQLVKTIRRHRVTTVHFVPSMLRAFIAEDDAEKCTSLRRLISSGEALTAHDKAAFYARFDARLYNLYGPTEAAIDVTHHTCLPEDSGPVPIGRPIANVRMYVLDRSLAPVPSGVTGDLYIGGTAVGRGYFNRPALTAERFIPDPYGKPGDRLYATGDRARYRDDGEIEFLGRLDNQVKIRGLRIEIGEVEAQLSRYPGVCAAIVLVDEGGSQLVGYVVVDFRDNGPTLDLDDLRAHLRRQLPGYMVPNLILPIREIPVTANGKLDRAALPKPSGARTVEYVEPATPAEKVIARIWASALRVERVGRDDNFFELGGDSIMSMQVAGAARREGYFFEVRQLLELPSLRDLAAVAVRKQGVCAEQGAIVGDAPLAPIHNWFIELALPRRSHWNQAVLLDVRQPIARDALHHALEALYVHHDALRLVLVATDAAPRLRFRSPEATTADFEVEALPDDAADEQGALAKACDRANASLDLERGPIFKAIAFTRGGQVRHLLLVAHHVAIDVLSWRVLFEDLELLIAGSSNAGATQKLPAKTMSYKAWLEAVAARKQTPEIRNQLRYWRSLPWEGTGAARWRVEPCRECDTLFSSVPLSAAETQALARGARDKFGATLEHVLLATLSLSLADTTDFSTVIVQTEGHGRDTLEGLDFSRTVGWFTSLLPVPLPITRDPKVALKAAKEEMRRGAARGDAFGLLRYHEAVSSADAAALPSPQICLNYLGELVSGDRGGFGISLSSPGPVRDPLSPRAYLLDIDARVSPSEGLLVEFRATPEVPGLSELPDRFAHALTQMLELVRKTKEREFTPSDFPNVALDTATLERITTTRTIDRIYPLVPMQEAFLVQSLASGERRLGVEQMSCTVVGHLDRHALQQAWQLAVQRHEALRSSFMFVPTASPLQVVSSRIACSVDFEAGHTERDRATERARIDAFAQHELERGFDLTEPPLFRVSVLQLSENRWRIVFTYHHAILDGWSLPLLLGEVLAIYDGIASARPVSLESPPPYDLYLNALARRTDTADTERYWSSALRAFDGPTVLPTLPAAGNSPRPVSLSEDFGQALLGRLNALARRRRVTLNTIFQAAWAVLLADHTERRRVTFGKTVSGRDVEVPRVGSMVGVFMNVVPLTTELPRATSVSDWLPRLQYEQSRQASAEWLPLGKIQQLSSLPASMPLFDSVLVFQNYPQDRVRGAGAEGIALESIEAPVHTAFRLTLCVLPEPNLTVSLAFDQTRLTTESALRVLHRLKAVLVQFADNPEIELDRVRAIADEEIAELDHDAEDLVGAEEHLPASAVGTRVYVVQHDGGRVPRGVPGRLLFVGPDESFADARRSGHASELLGRRRSDGALQILGGLAAGVERRGATLLLADVEEVLRNLSEARAVEARLFGKHQRLVAVVALDPKAALAAEAVRQHLAAHLPASMLPDVVLVTGDEARRQREGFSDAWLAELLDQQKRDTRAPASTPTEQRLLELWTELLGTTEIGIEDDFFALGGQSVAVMSMIGRIGTAFHCSLSVRDVFDSRTIRAIARTIDQRTADGANGANTPARVLASMPIVHNAGTTLYPLSPYQLPEWFYHELAPDSPMYNIFEAIYLNGPLELEAFRKACEALLTRHPVLRTTIDFVDGTPSQRVGAPRLLSLDEFYVAYPDVPEDEIAEHAAHKARELGAELLDFARGPLFKFKLVGYANECFLFAFLTNHIVWDELSSFVLGRELAHFYNAFRRGVEPELPCLPFGYMDYAAWVNRVVEGKVFDAQRQYWLRRFSPLPAPLELPLDFQRPSQMTFNGAEVHRVLSPALVRRIQALVASRPGMTMTSFLSASFGLVLHKLSGQTDIVVGVPYANRAHESLEGIVGPFATALPIRMSVRPDASFTELLEETRHTYIEALDNAAYPSVLAIRELDPPSDHSRPKLFSVMMGLQNDKEKFWREMVFDDLAIATFPTWREVGPYNTSSRTDLRFLIDQFGDSFVFLLSFNTDLFARESVERWADYLLAVMQRGAAEPSAAIRDFTVASEQEQRRTEARNDTREEFDLNTPIYAVFERLAAQQPQHIAIDDGVERVTYGQLNERANALAHALLERGVGREERVGVLFEPSPNLVVALLAVLKAGAAYVAIAPDQPRSRQEAVLSQARARFAVSSRALVAERSDQVDWLLIEEEQHRQTVRDNPARATHPASIACAFFTSGSTGAPKGILLEHKGIANLIWSTQSVYGLKGEDATLFITPYTFDVSLLDVLWPLAVGARIVIPNALEAKDPRAIARWVETHEVTTLQCVPVLLDALVDAREHGRIGALPSLRFVMCAGAALPRSLARRCHKTFSFLLANHYGPTEATVDVSRFDTTRRLEDEIVPIGRPVSNTELHVLGPSLAPVPSGAVGELCIGSVQLARGYLDDPQKTASCFVPNPFGPPGSRMYRTGDLAKVSNDDVLCFVGRVDRQVKVRGNRVELEEVEAHLARHPDVSRTAIVHRKDVLGTDSLAAFVELRESTTTIQNGSETYRIFTLAQRPDLARATESVHAESWPDFFAGNKEPRALWPRLNAELPGFQLAVVNASDHVIAVVNTAPLSWNGRTQHIPAGWDAALAESLRQFDQESRPNTLLILAGAVSSEAVGTGLSALVVRAFKHLAARRGLEHVLAPVRPNGKVAAPAVSAAEWSRLRRADGQLVDAWMRVHERAGGKILRADDYSQLVQGTFEEWERWLGVPLNSLPEFAPSQVVVERALAPVLLDRARMTAEYVDPCVWMRHEPAVEWTGVAHTDPGALRQWLSNRLPAYMVPDQLQIIASMPLTATGKIDMRSLPQGIEAERRRVEPETETQRILVGIWNDILKTETGITDDFFAMGGHSLRAVQMLARIEAEFDVRIPVSVFLRNSNIRHLEHLVHTQARSVSEPRRNRNVGMRNDPTGSARPSD